MSLDTSRRHQIGDFTVVYPVDEKSGRIGLELFPTALKTSLAARRDGLAGEPFIDAMPGAGNPPACVLDSLAQIKIVGDAYTPGFGQGHTMRNAASVDSFRFDSQRTCQDGTQTCVVTTLKNNRGHRIEHRLAWHDGDASCEVTTALFNDSDQPVTLEMLCSFSLGGITPFHPADAPERLRVHRFRSVWSAEGRLETQSIEQLHLERSWSGAGAFSERFGQIGTMPVRTLVSVRRGGRHRGRRRLGGATRVGRLVADGDFPAAR